MTKMAEYIEREAFQAALQKKKADIANKRYTEGWNDCLMRIKSMVSCFPAADAAPVVHGRWVQKKEWHLGRWVAWFECSECGEHDDNSDMYEMMPFCNLSNYCPGCGAKMDEVSE